MLQDGQESQPLICIEPRIPPENRRSLRERGWMVCFHGHHRGSVPGARAAMPCRVGISKAPLSKLSRLKRQKYQLSVLFCEGHNCSHPNISTLQCQGLRHSALRCIAFRLWQVEAASHLGALVLDSVGSVLLPAVAHGWLSLEAVSNSSFQWTHTKTVNLSVLLSGSRLLCPSDSLTSLHKWGILTLPLSSNRWPHHFTAVGTALRTNQEMVTCFSADANITQSRAACWRNLKEKENIWLPF